MHSAHRTIGLSPELSAVQACDLTEVIVVGRRRRHLHVGLVADASDGACDGSLGRLQEYLADQDDLICSRMYHEGSPDTMGFALDYADCLLVLARRPIGDTRLRRQIWWHCRRGGATVLLGASSGLMSGRAEAGMAPWKDGFACGEGVQPALVHIPVGVHDHPVLAGVRPFVARGMTSLGPEACAGNAILVVAPPGGPERVVVWTRLEHGARIVCASLGEAQDFHQDGFLRLVRNAIYWTCKHSPAHPQ